MKELSKDSLVIVLDLEAPYLEIAGAIGEVYSEPFPGYREYVQQRLTNIKSLLDYCEVHTLDVLRAFYFSKRIPAIAKTPITFWQGRQTFLLKNRPSLNRYQTLYFCGMSSDGCVLRRPLGFCKVKTSNQKVILINCCIQFPWPTYAAINCSKTDFFPEKIKTLANFGDVPTLLTYERNIFSQYQNCLSSFPQE